MDMNMNQWRQAFEASQQALRSVPTTTMAMNIDMNQWRQAFDANQQALRSVPATNMATLAANLHPAINDAANRYVLENSRQTTMNMAAFAQHMRPVLENAAERLALDSARQNTSTTMATYAQGLAPVLHNAASEYLRQRPATSMADYAERLRPTFLAHAAALKANEIPSIEPTGVTQQIAATRSARPVSNSMAKYAEGLRGTLLDTARAAVEAGWIGPNPTRRPFVTSTGLNRQNPVGPIAGITSVTHVTSSLSSSQENALAGVLTVQQGVYALAAKEAAQKFGVVTAVGLSVEAAKILGVNAGTGLYFTPDGKAGLYFSAGVTGGIVRTASFSEQITVIRSYDDFIGWCRYSTLGVSVGTLPLALGGSLISNANGEFVGVAGSAGLSVGAVLAAYTEYSHTWAAPH